MGQGHLVCFSGVLVQTARVFKLSLYFDFNYTPVRFGDCVLEGCDAISVKKSTNRKI